MAKILKNIVIFSNHSNILVNQQFIVTGTLIDGCSALILAPENEFDCEICAKRHRLPNYIPVTLVLCFFFIKFYNKFFVWSDEDARPQAVYKIR